MIVFEKKPEPLKPAVAAPKPAAVAVPAVAAPAPVGAEANPAETTRKKAAARSKKADTDGTRRRDKQAADDNRLL